MQKLFFLNLVFFLRSVMKIEGSGSISQRHGSADPDPHQNVMDPQHCFKVRFYNTIFNHWSIPLNMGLDILSRASVPARESQLLQGHLHVLPHGHLWQDPRQATESFLAIYFHSQFCQPWTKELKDTNPLMSSLLVICLGWCNNFVGSESGQKQSVKLLQNMVYTTIQHPPIPPPPSHTHCPYILYSTFSLGGGGGQREGKVEGQQYTSIVPSSMGATVHKLGKKYKPLSECISSL